MYASRITIFLLAFVVALASAVPLHSHHRRSKCHRRATAPDVAANIPETSTRGYSPPASVKTGSPIPSSSAEPDETKESKESKKPTKTKEVEDPTETSKSSAPDSSDAPAPSESSSSGSGSGSGGYSGGLLGSLFPVSNLISSWTTCSAARDDTQELSDAVFRPVSDMKDLPHPYVDGPEGKRSMKAHYPKGSYNFQHEPKGGFSFYAPGPSDVDLTTAKEATFGYSVYFRDGFGFQKGGKLPGLYGGDSASESLSCSGGRRDNGCFSARLMWRTKGQVELYTYLPPDHNDGLCDKVPNSDCNPTYGASLGRGAATFPTGEWVAVSQRLKLNDVGKSNGELELFVNGKSVVNVRGLVITTSEAGRIRGMQMQTFFGGSSPDFASPKDQDVYFSDFSVSITKKR